MTGEEVRKLSDDEIKAEIVAIRRKTYDLRVQSTTEKVENTSQFRKLRQDLARLLTERTGRFAKKRAASAKPRGPSGRPVEAPAKAQTKAQTKGGAKVAVKAPAKSKGGSRATAKAAK